MWNFKKCLATFCLKDKASFREADHVLWSNITGSLRCEIKDFVQNNSQATKALEDEKGKNEVNSKSAVNIMFESIKMQNKKEMDVFTFFIPFLNICPNYYTYKKHSVPRNNL